MSHQDRTDVLTNPQALKAILGGLFEEAQECPRHGNATIDPGTLAVVALICWGWSCDDTLDDRISSAVLVVNRVFGSAVTVTRQGVMKALASCGSDLVDIVVQHFAKQVRGLKGLWSNQGKVNFAVDGTKLAAPRSEANQERLAARSHSKRRKKYRTAADRAKANTCQLLVTTIWHIGSGLPYRWLVKGSSGSERSSLIEMLDALPKNARFIADAEYVGYRLWSTIIQSKRSFLFRIGSNVSVLKNLGTLKLRNGFVYYWPNQSMRRSQPPIVLRLIKIHNGKSTIYLVTNELEMTDEQAADLYRQRWRIEVFFRSVKQNCRRAKLRCQTPDNIVVEANWTLLGIWVALFSASQVLRDQRRPLSRISPIKVVRAFQMTVVAIALQAKNASNLHDQLAKAVRVDESDRTTSKASKNYPRKKRHKPTGKPIILEATAAQKKRAKMYLE